MRQGSCKKCSVHFSHPALDTSNGPSHTNILCLGYSVSKICILSHVQGLSVEMILMMLNSICNFMCPQCMDHPLTYFFSSCLCLCLPLGTLQMTSGVFVYIQQYHKKIFNLYLLSLDSKRSGAIKQSEPKESEDYYPQILYFIVPFKGLFWTL